MKLFNILQTEVSGIRQSAKYGYRALMALQILPVAKNSLQVKFKLHEFQVSPQGNDSVSQSEAVRPFLGCYMSFAGPDKTT